MAQVWFLPFECSFSIHKSLLFYFREH